MQKSTPSRILYLGLEPPPGVIHYPVIRTEKIAGGPMIQKAIDAWPLFSHVIFTSKTTVRYWFEIKPDFNKVAIAIGEATAFELKQRGIDSLIPAEATQEGIVELLKKLKPSYLFLPRSKLARNILPDYFLKEAIPFLAIDLYDTVLQEPGPPIDLKEIDEVVFTSPSTVEGFIKIYGVIPNDKRITSIGPVTANSIRLHRTNTIATLSRVQI